MRINDCDIILRVCPYVINRVYNPNRPIDSLPRGPCRRLFIIRATVSLKPTEISLPPAPCSRFVFGLILRSNAARQRITTPQPPRGWIRVSRKSTFSRLTSGIGFRSSPKSPQSEETIAEGTSTTTQPGVFGSLTKGLVDTSRSAVKAVQAPYRPVHIGPAVDRYADRSLPSEEEEEMKKEEKEKKYLASSSLACCLRAVVALAALAARGRLLSPRGETFPSPRIGRETEA
ncbi:hypothetical protein GW17_00055585, partial [Ensete ventricosum]